MTPVTISSLAIILFSALIHASFQLSLSVLTLLSGHSIGKKTAHQKVINLMAGFIFGVLLMTTLLLSSLSYYLSLLIHHVNSTEQFVAAITCGVMIGLGIATWAFYYRRSGSTALWLPRSFADYLTKRTKKTRNAVEAIALGMTSVIAEIIFIIGPLIAGSLAIITLPNTNLQLVGIMGYLVLSIIPLLIITLLVGGGTSIASLQKWRETHKRFLQFASGGSLLILAGFLFTDRVIGIISYGGSLW